MKIPTPLYKAGDKVSIKTLTGDLKEGFVVIDGEPTWNGRMWLYKIETASVSFGEMYLVNYVEPTPPSPLISSSPNIEEEMNDLMFEHSPGWEIYVTRPQYHNDCYEVRNPYGHLDEDEDFDKHCEEVDEANRALIENAPTLLEHNKLLQERVRVMGEALEAVLNSDMAQREENEGRVSETLDKVRAAIALATQGGESNEA
jgi:hypothetical protein